MLLTDPQKHASTPFKRRAPDIPRVGVESPRRAHGGSASSTTDHRSTRAMQDARDCRADVIAADDDHEPAAPCATLGAHLAFVWDESMFGADATC